MSQPRDNTPLPNSYSSGAPPTYASTYNQPNPDMQQPLNMQYSYASPQPVMAAQPVMMAHQQQQQGGQPTLLIIGGPQGIWPHYPVTTVCPHCGAHVTTATRKTSGALAWLACGGLALAGCIFGCCLIPFCVDGCLDTEHWCPSCHRLIARRAQMDC